MKKPVNVTPCWVHTWHCKPDRNPELNVVGVKEKIITEYDDGSVEYTDNLRMFPNPKRKFWVTKPNLRNHDFKKEFELIENCNMYICHDSDLERALASSLNVYHGKYSRLRNLCSSPYVYGADIETPVLIKMDYLKKSVGKVPVISRGFLDIENEIDGDQRINVCTFIHERHIYTAALKEYVKTEKGPASYDDCLKVIEEEIGDSIRNNEFSLEFVIMETELELIKWIFEKIHFHKTDFCGIWNINHDAPHIIERLEALGVDPATIMCHPDVPRHLQFVRYHRDEKKVDHFTDHWHWLHMSGYTQMIDQLNLYARLRKVSGRDSSYSLDSVADKELGDSKLHTSGSTITSHWHEQNFNFLRYMAYNIKDVILIALIEFKNNDMQALLGLAGNSLLSQFASQTILIRNDAYVYGLTHGRVPASAGTKMFTEYDDRLPKDGGAVLPPDKAVNVGVPILKEMSHTTMVSLFANDLDVSSEYPSVTSGFNISKETNLATVFFVNGKSHAETEILFAAINRPDLNAVQIGYQFFGLPNYKEMADKYRMHKGMVA